MRCLVFTFSVVIIDAFDLLEFKELLIIYSFIVLVSLDLDLVALIDLHDLFDDVDFLHCKLYAAKFDNIASLHDIVNLVVVMLETPDH